MIYLALYLAAVVAANLTIAALGPSASVVTAFLLIGLTLTLRDKIHDVTPRAVPVAILGGAAISLLFGAGQIALASAAAFALSEGADSLVYVRLRHLPWLQRANGSNVVGAAVDSLVFPVLAFGGFPVWIIAGQFLAKTAGGAVWSLILQRRAVAVAAVALLMLARPAPAQIASVSAGALHTPYGTEAVAEVYVAGPAALGLRPYVIASWSPLAEFDAHKPVVVTQVAYSLLANRRVLLTADAGATWFPFTGYRPVPTVGARLGVFLPARLQAFALVSAQPRSEWERSYVIGLSRNVLFIR